MVEVGSWVWVPDDVGKDYVIPGQVLAVMANGISARLEGGEELKCKVDPDKLKVLDKQCLDPEVSNLIGLSNLSENAILHNLRIRFHKECIYTFVSSILIAVNPFRQLPLYGVEIREKYLATADKSTLPPHIFTIADNSFRAMMADNMPQSVVISGESGAGKTESTKVILEYIAELSGGHDDDENLQHQILQCNPMMEAFGNAKTVRNNNSSRFGKLITIHFMSGVIKGASIISYLLEKSRVVHQQPQERNYHFFYQLIAAAAGDPQMSAMLHLGNVDANATDKDVCDTEDFWYTNQSSVHAIEGMSDLDEYNEVRSAMESLGMSTAEQNDICKVTAAILHLGNVCFSEAETAGDVAAKIKDPSIIQTVCTLLEVSVNEMERCLTSKNIGARSIITCRYTPLQAIDARDALAKKLYANLFDWLIKFINVSLAGSSKEASLKMSFIAVLDIFGFEAFEHNSFEQLCINYCNEKLQFHFNNHIFLMEQEEYAKEGINVSNIQFEDNQSTLDLLDLKATGIFSMIDEEINVPRGSDEQLLSKLFHKHLQHPHFERPKAKNHSKSVMDVLFVVVHYAGPVGYNVSGFLEKNKDQLSEDLEQMCKVSNSSFIQNIFGVAEKSPDAPPEAPRVRASRRTGGGGHKNTLGGEFKKQLESLMDTLNKTDPHFVRCMKPNMEKVGKVFDSHVMLAQLRYAGLVEVCRIRQLGYPYRMAFEKFLNLYTILAPMGGGSPEKLLTAIVDKKYLNADEFAIGSTKLFLKQSALQKLNVQRDVSLKDVVATIQKMIRGKLKRIKFASMKKILKNLEKAMDASSGTVDVPQLESALALAVELPHEGVHFPLVKEGKSLSRKVTEEMKVKALLEEAMKEGVLSALEGALDTAHTLQTPHKVRALAAAMTEAKSKLVVLKKEKSHLDAVPKLIKSGKLSDMEQWMEIAQELNLLETEAARSIEVIISRIGEEKSILDDLAIATDAKNLPMITALLSRAAEMGMDNATVAKAKKAQQILESMVSGHAALTTALETTHLQTIKDAISKAKTCGVSFDDSLLKKATYMADVIENIELVEAKLKVALNGHNIEELTSLIAKGEQALGFARDQDCTLEIASLSAAVSLVESLERQQKQNEAEKAAEMKLKDEHAEKLQSALDRQEIPYLRSLLVQAKGMGLGSHSKYNAILKNCDEAVEKMKQKQELEIILNSAVRSKNVDKITECIAKVEASGINIKLDSAIKVKKSLIAQESIHQKLDDALAKNDVEVLASLVKAADDIKFASRQVEDARAMLDRGANLSQVTAILQTSKDNNAIVDAIAAAINFGLDKNDPLLESARARLAELSANNERFQDFKIIVKNFEIRASTENGIKAEDLNPLSKLLSEVSGLSSSASEDTLLQTLLQDIKMQITRGENLIKQQALLDGLTDSTPLHEVKSVVRKAADLGLKNYRGFISSSTLLEELQSRAAKNQNDSPDDEEDEDEMTYEEMDRLKEEQHAEARQIHYKFSNFPNLRTAEEFAKGSMLNKKKIMDGFLKHQKSPITRALTTLSGTENKKAVVAFKSLLGYIGDKSVTFPASHARDFVMIGLKSQSLRAELFLQCVKQTISNPSPHSQMRAFHVLCMCCDHFPPPPDFHKYLLNFLLNHADATAEGADPSPVEHMAGYALARIQIMVQQAVGNDDQAIQDVDVDAIEAYSFRMPSVATIYTPDDALLGELLVAPDVDVETLLLLIAQILNIHPQRIPLLGLYAVTTKSSDLAPMTLLPDREFYVGDVYQPPLSLKIGRPIKYFIKRKLLEDSFLTPLSKLEEDEEETEENITALNNLTYSQISMKMGDDSIRITNEKTAAQLAAYQLAIDAEYIAGRADIALAQGVLKNLSPTLRESREPNYWGNLIGEALHKCVGKEDDELKQLYLELVDTLPTARMHTYMCVKGGGSSPAQTSDVPKEFVLGVNSKGMFFMDCDDEKEAPTSHYTLRYPLIKKFTLKSNIIKFTLEKAPGELYALEVVTPLNEELCQLCLAFRPRRKVH